MLKQPLLGIQFLVMQRMVVKPKAWPVTPTLCSFPFMYPLQSRIEQTPQMQLDPVDGVLQVYSIIRAFLQPRVVV